MTDMLVALYALGDGAVQRDRAAQAGVSVRRALAPERRVVLPWIEQRFGGGWAAETEAAFAATPTRCLVALRGQVLLGFAAWDVTALGFFGPTGVSLDARGEGVGAALLMAVLCAMREAGYGYAVIGAAGAPEFFTRVAGAVAIMGSTPGIYREMLRPA
jgi:GNAT superfamily N-acetyltransferase